MTELTTNRDLYLAVTELTKSKADAQPTLESYLATLRQLATPFAERDSITINEFYRLICESFSTQDVQFDEGWGDEYGNRTDEKTGFQGWRSTITRQIVDLHEMAQSGTLQNEMRYFGVKAPRGAYWFNFDPCTYLECAVAGTIGGWEPDDDSGRTYVPGPVAVLDDNDNIVSMDPEDVPRPIYPIPVVSWDLFRDFLQSGQQYE